MNFSKDGIIRCERFQGYIPFEVVKPPWSMKLLGSVEISSQSDNQEGTQTHSPS